MKRRELKIDKSAMAQAAGDAQVVTEIPHPRYSVKRVWIYLITKELTFVAATKSLQ
jgi:hypothetical protein